MTTRRKEPIPFRATFLPTPSYPYLGDPTYGRGPQKVKGQPHLTRWAGRGRYGSIYFPGKRSPATNAPTVARPALIGEVSRPVAAEMPQPTMPPNAAPAAAAPAVVLVTGSGFILHPFSWCVGTSNALVSCG